VTSTITAEQFFALTGLLGLAIVAIFLITANIDDDSGFYPDSGSRWCAAIGLLACALSFVAGALL